MVDNVETIEINDEEEEDDGGELEYSCSSVENITKHDDDIKAEKRPDPPTYIPSQCSSSDESSTCVICLDNWTTNGKHRICALRCGHLFGKSCIERWLREKGVNGKCPQCNAKAQIKDLRNLFVKKLAAIDRSELDKNVEIEKKLRREAEESETRALVKYQNVLTQLEYTKMELRHYKNLYHENQHNTKSDINVDSTEFIANTDINETTDCNGSFKFVSSMKVSDAGGCRISCYSRPMGIHVVSKPSPNWNLCPGYGILKINSIEFYSSRTKTEFFRLHSNVIRDIAFSPHTPNHILTVSIDKTIKVSNIEINTQILTYNTDVPVWSCCWDEHDTNVLYAGLANGSVNVYDIRNTHEIVESMSANSFGFTSNRAPVISIKPIHVVPPSNNNNLRPRYGLCVTALDCFYFVEKTQHQIFPHRFQSIKGSFMSMKVDSTNTSCLYTLRPNPGRKNITHYVGTINYLDGNTNNDIIDRDHFDILTPLEFNISKEYRGGNRATQMCRSTLINLPDRDVSMVMAGDEESKTVMIWNMLTGKNIQNLSYDTSTILDIENFCIGQYAFISTLSDSTLSIYRWLAEN